MNGSYWEAALNHGTDPLRAAMGRFQTFGHRPVTRTKLSQTSPNFIKFDV